MTRVVSLFVTSAIALAVSFPAHAEAQSGAAPMAPAAPTGSASPAAPSAGGPLVPKVEPLKPRPFTIEDRYLDAARRGDMRMLEMCLDKGADVRAKDDLGRSAFLLSVRDARNLEMAKFLQGRGLPIDDPDNSGRTPLGYAAGNGNMVLVAYLLEQGADPKHRDTQGQSPLFNAVLGGSKETVAKLLTLNVDIDVQDRFGDTPLMGACNKGYDDIARMLVEKGADVKLKDQEGRTARERADESSKYCPQLDVAGTNSGGGAASVPAETGAPASSPSAPTPEHP